MSYRSFTRDFATCFLSKRQLETNSQPLWTHFAHEVCCLSSLVVLCRIQSQFPRKIESVDDVLVQFGEGIVLVDGIIFYTMSNTGNIDFHALTHLTHSSLTYKGSHGWCKDRATLDHKRYTCTHNHGHVSCQPAKRMWQVCWDEARRDCNYPHAYTWIFSTSSCIQRSL